MKKFLKWTALSLGILVATAWIFWPEEWAVRGPILSSIGSAEIEAPKAETLHDLFTVPEGYQVTLYSDDVSSARLMVEADNGDLLVSGIYDDVIYRLSPDRDGDGKADNREIILSGLDAPHGMAFRDGWFYLAELRQISRYKYDQATGEISTDREVVYDNLPVTRTHGRRPLHFGPDGKLYVALGSTCNVCVEQDERLASIMQMEPDGSNARLFATGLRNAVDFTWEPATGDMYATDNGRDLLGALLPQDELNRVVDGGFYGWPHYYDDNVFDPSAGDTPALRALKDKAIVMEHGLGAHDAPLGLYFLNSSVHPADYQGALLVAKHGSWNSPTLVGYKVTSLHKRSDGSFVERDFMTGFLVGEDEVIGRPVGVLEASDGAIYITDDYAGAVYKVMYIGD